VERLVEDGISHAHGLEHRLEAEPGGAIVSIPCLNTDRERRLQARNVRVVVSKDAALHDEAGREANVSGLREGWNTA
jgi:hypothetical protein